MSNVSFQLPLLDLPERGMKRVLQQLDLNHLLTFSFISQQAKNAVASLKHLHPYQIIINISEGITLKFVCRVKGKAKLHKFEIFKKPPCVITPDTTVLPVPVVAEVFENYTGGVTPFSSSKKNFGLKEYLEHLFGIFKCENKTELGFDTPFVLSHSVLLTGRQDVLPAEPIYEAFKNVHIGRISIRTRFHEQLIKRFLPKADVYVIWREHPFNKQFLRTILIQNLTKFEIHGINAQYAITLDDLLLINSSYIMITTEFNEKDLNTFFRSWQFGSNPRLRRLIINFISPTKINEELALKGTKFQNCTRFFGFPGDYKIQHVDGISAEIIFRCDYHGISMYVID
ncbi:unnamed protein product [Caenorhabditis brenneri]